MADTANYTFKKRISTMLRVDLKRLFLSRAFYIIIASCLLAPILILVMTTMMDGTVSIDPQTGKETVMEGFDNVWQIIGTVSASGSEAGAGMDMGLTAMCNINMLYFAIAALVCIFVSEDFISGYCKNLFTVRAKKTDYVISKTLVLDLGAAIMVIAFVLGSLIGGAVSSLPFDMVGFTLGNLLLCVLSKILLVGIFVPIYLTMSVVAKDKLWLSLILSMAVGMLLFMMIPMLTPLDSTLTNVLVCILGALGLGSGLGAISNLVLKKTSLV